MARGARTAAHGHKTGAATHGMRVTRHGDKCGRARARAGARQFAAPRWPLAARGCIANG